MPILCFTPGRFHGLWISRLKMLTTSEKPRSVPPLTEEIEEQNRRSSPFDRFRQDVLLITLWNMWKYRWISPAKMGKNQPSPGKPCTFGGKARPKVSVLREMPVRRAAALRKTCPGTHPHPKAQPPKTATRAAEQPSPYSPECPHRRDSLARTARSGCRQTGRGPVLSEPPDRAYPAHG